MKVLFLTPQLPFPAHQGTSLRNYHILRGLAGEHDIALLSFVEGEIPERLPDEITELCSQVVTVTAPRRSTWRRIRQVLSSRQPDMALRLASDKYEAALETLLGEGDFDIVQVEGIELAWTLPALRRAAPQAAVLYDAHNAETLLQARSAAADRGKITRWPAVLYSRLQSSRLARYETWVCNEADAITAVSVRDSEALRKLSSAKDKPISVIPNSIDVTTYATDEVKQKIPFDVVFSGKMDYRPNVDAVLWFADEIWPIVKKEKPEATWAIVGQKPHTRLNRLREIPGVTLTGWVPQIKPYLAGAKVFVMPFRVGSGTRLKLIEAFAAGRAVVSTSVGVEGFGVKDEKHLLIGDTAEAFAAKIVALLDDSALRSQLGSEGQQFAEHYDWRIVTPKFREVYERFGK